MPLQMRIKKPRNRKFCTADYCTKGNFLFYQSICTLTADIRQHGVKLESNRRHARTTGKDHFVRDKHKYSRVPGDARSISRMDGV